MLLAVPTVLSGIIVLLSKKNLALIESASPVAEFSLLLTLIIVNVTGLGSELTSIHRLGQIFVLGSFSLAHMLYMTVSWLPHLICHSIALYSSLSYLMIMRKFKGEEQYVLANLIFAFLTFSSIELTVYLKIRSMARLFFKLQVIEQ